MSTLLGGGGESRARCPADRRPMARGTRAAPPVISSGGGWPAVQYSNAPVRVSRRPMHRVAAFDPGTMLAEIVYRREAFGDALAGQQFAAESRSVAEPSPPRLRHRVRRRRRRPEKRSRNRRASPRTSRPRRRCPGWPPGIRQRCPRPAIPAATAKAALAEPKSQDPAPARNARTVLRRGLQLPCARAPAR